MIIVLYFYSNIIKMDLIEFIEERDIYLSRKFANEKRHNRFLKDCLQKYNNIKSSIPKKKYVPSPITKSYSKSVATKPTTIHKAPMSNSNSNKPSNTYNKKPINYNKVYIKPNNTYTKPKYEYTSELRYVRDKLKKGKYLSLDDINFLKSEHKIFEKIIKDIEKENIELIKKINEKELQIKEKVILEKEKKLRERRKKIQEERRLYEERLIQEEELISREEQELRLEKEELIPEEETNFKKWVSRRQNNETSEWQTVCKK